MKQLVFRREVLSSDSVLFPTWPTCILPASSWQAERCLHPPVEMCPGVTSALESFIDTKISDIYEVKKLEENFFWAKATYLKKKKS